MLIFDPSTAKLFNLICHSPKGCLSLTRSTNSITTLTYLKMWVTVARHNINWDKLDLTWLMDEYNINKIQQTIYFCHVFYCGLNCFSCNYLFLSTERFNANGRSMLGSAYSEFKLLMVFPIIRENMKLNKYIFTYYQIQITWIINVHVYAITNINTLTTSTQYGIETVRWKKQT